MNKIRKHLLSIVAAGAMLCTTLPSVALPSFAIEKVPTLNDNDTPDNTKDDYYEISNVEQLFWFAELVNGSEEKEPVPDANAKLMNNIDCSGYDEWSMIGANNYYSGHFDGNNYYISGLSQVAETEDDCDAGFVYSLDKGGSIKNLTLKKCKFVGSNMAAGFCCLLQKGMISECALIDSSVVSRGALYVGGIVARSIRSASGTGTIMQCHCDGGLSNSKDKDSDTYSGYLGCIVGELNAGTVIECLSTGSINIDLDPSLPSSQYYGPIAGMINSNSGAKVDSCYWLKGMPENVFDSKPEVGNLEEIHCVDLREMLSGYVCVQLNNGTIAFHQNIGIEYPTLEKNHHTPYTTNEFDPDTGRLVLASDPCQYDDDGFCTLCGNAMPATDTNKDGCYEIGNVGQLFWFRDYISDGHYDADAILTADIVVNYDSVDDNEVVSVVSVNGQQVIIKEPILLEAGDITHNLNNYRTWQSVTTKNVGYKGKFDGQGHVISGLVLATTNHMGLLFDKIAEGGVVKNLGIVDSYVPFLDNCDGIGGFCVENCGTILNSYFVGTFKYNKTKIAGGICNTNHGNILNSYSYIMNANGTTCTYGICEVNGQSGVSDPDIGFIQNVCSREMEYETLDAITDMIAIGTNNAANQVKDCTMHSTNAFASGEVCALLNARAGEEIWYQELGKDLTPVLDPKHGSVNGFSIQVGEETISKYLNGSVVGDANNDNAFTIADIVLFQRWLTGDPAAEISNWNALDISGDGSLSVIDLALLKSVLTAQEGN